MWRCVRATTLLTLQLTVLSDLQDTTSLPQPSSSYSLPGTSSQNPVVGTDTTYPNVGHSSF